MGLGNHNLILEEAGLVISQGRHEISLAESPHTTCALNFPIGRSCPAATSFIQESQPGFCPHPGPEAWTLPFQVSEVSTLLAAGGARSSFALPQLYCWVFRQLAGEILDLMSPSPALGRVKEYSCQEARGAQESPRPS